MTPPAGGQRKLQIANCKLQIFNLACGTFFALLFPACTIAGGQEPLNRPGRTLNRPGRTADAFPQIRQVLVPVDSIAEHLNPSGNGTDRPARDWQAIGRRDYEALLHAAQPPPPGPDKAWIEFAEYSATFQNDTLRGGLLRATVKHFGDRAELMSLEPLNLAVSRLRWSKLVESRELKVQSSQPSTLDSQQFQDAVWGAMPDGRTALLVDSEHAKRLPARTFFADWTLKGRRLPYNVEPASPVRFPASPVEFPASPVRFPTSPVEFDVQVAPAVVSRFLLRVPEGYTVRCSAGHVARPQPADQPGFLVWRIDLGSRTRCLVTVSQEQKQAPHQQPLSLISSDVSYVVRQEGLELRAEFHLEVLRAAVKRLRFLLPAEMEVFSVTYGTDTPLGHKTVTQGGVGRLDVELPDPLLGLSRPIRIRGIAPAKLGRQWTLPPPSLRGAVLMTGRVNLQVDSPLVLQSIRASGYRQTAMVADAAEGETFTFQQFSPDARILVEVDTPRSILSAHEVTHVAADAETWELTSEIEWEARAGSTFVTRCSLPPKWKITDVRGASDSPGSGIAHWEITRKKGGGRVLVLEFLESLDPGTSHRVNVLASRLSAPPGEEVALPVPRPLDSGDVEILLAVSHLPRVLPVLVPGSGDAGSRVKQLEPDELPEFAQASPLFQAVKAGEKRPRLLLVGNTTTMAGKLYFKSTEPPVTAHVQVRLDVDSNQVSESFFARFQTVDAPVDRVFIYLTSTGPALVWELLAERKSGNAARGNAAVRRLSAERIPKTQYGQWNLPAGDAGELWKVALPSPQEGEFRIAASRTRTLAASENASLAFVPRAQEFQGVVELRVKKDVEIDVQADGLRAVDASAVEGRAAAARLEHSSRLWSYHEMTDRLTLRFPEENMPAQTGPLARLALRSLICAGNSGNDVHWARYEIGEPSNRGQFRFQLPAPAQLIEVRINGKKTTPSGQGRDYLLPPLPNRPSNVVEIHYQTPIGGRTSSSSGLLRVRREIVIPRTTYTVLFLRWELAIPPELRIAAEPNSVSLVEALPKRSSLRRFFGPLGRSSDEEMFNPFLRSSWRKLFLGMSNRRPAARPVEPPLLVESAFPPAGWKVWRATAPSSPAVVILEMWNQPRVLLSSWIGLFGCLAVGFVLRLLSLPHRGYLAAYWLVPCMAAAWLAPPVSAQIAGGCLAGTIIAILFPRALLLGLRFSTRDRQGISLGSTLSMHRAATTALLIGTALPLMAWAQELRVESRGSREETRNLALNPQPSTLNSQPSTRNHFEVTRNHFEVMIPVGPDLKPLEKSSLVYVTKELIARLRELKESRRQRAEYLISSADYQATFDAKKSVAVDATYKIAVLSAETTTWVHLPIRHANLAGPGECRVNGKPQPVLRSRDGNDLVVELAPMRSRPAMPVASRKSKRVESGGSRVERRNSELSSPLSTLHSPLSTLNPQLFEVVLRLRPPVSTVSGGGSFKMGIPAVCASRLSLKFAPPWGVDRRYEALNVAGARGEVTGPDDAGTATASLGKTGDFQVAWSANKQPTKEPASMEAEIACLIEAHPTRLEFHYRVATHVLRGNVDFVTWQIPREMIVREWRVESGGSRVESREFRVESSQPSTLNSQLLIEFSTPQTNDFVVSGSFTMPIRSGGETIRVPAIDLFGDRTPGENVRVTRNQLAVSTTSEFRASVPAGLPATAGSAKRPAATAVVDRLFKEWAKELGVREPQLAFQLSSSSELSFQLVRLVPRRTVLMNQEGRVGKTKLLWKLTAEIETSAPGAFQHRLLVDPRLTIDEISVEEDRAPRLVRWSRTGKRVVLFLSGKPKDIQDLSLTGSMPLGLGAEIALPWIRFEDAEVLQRSKLLLVHEPDVSVKLLEPARVELAKENPHQTAEDGNEIVLGPFRLVDDAKLPRIRVKARSDHVGADTLAVLERRTGGRWSLSTALRFHDFTRNASRLQIRIPAELTRDFQIAPDNVKRTEEKDADGSVLVTFEPERPPGGVFLATVRARSLAVPKRGQWKLPAVSAVDAGTGEHYLLLSSPDLMRPADSSAQPVERHSLPEWISRAAGIDPQAKMWNAFRLDKRPWTLVRQQSDAAVGQTRVPLIDTRIWLNRYAPEFGESTLFIIPNGGHSVDLAWPRGCHLRGLVVDGKATTSLIPSSGKLTVPLDATRATHIVTVCWSLDSDSAARHGRPWRRFGSDSQSYPQPRRVTLGRSILTLMPPPASQCVMRYGFTKTSSLDHSLDRLAGLLDMLHAQLAEAADQPAAWEALLREHELVRRRLAGASAAGHRWSDEQRQRFTLATRDVESLRQTANLAPSQAVRTVSTTSFGPQQAPAFANRKLVHGRLPVEDPLPSFSVWVIDDLVVTWILASVCLLIVIPVAHRLVRFEAGLWMEAHQPVSWALLGLVWWTCLSVSIIGPPLLLFAGFLAIRRPERTGEQEDFVVQEAGSADSSPDQS